MTDLAQEYRVLADSFGDYYQGDTFEATFTPGEETDYVRAGRLEIVARTYKVVGPRKVFGHANGEKFEAALAAGHEQVLIDGGQIVRSPRAGRNDDKSGDGAKPKPKTEEKEG